MTDVRALVLNGTVGVGKTTTAELVGRLWQQAGVPGAVIDVDRLRWAWPAPPDDRFNARLGLANLAAVVANHVRAGARRLVLADVVEGPVGRARQRAAIGLPTITIRLTADPDLIRARLGERHAHDHDDGAALGWHRARVTELAAILEASGCDDHVLDVTELDPPAAAAAVLELFER